MEFRTTTIPGLYVVDLNKLEDERGFFARAFCRSELDEVDLNSKVAQANISFNKLAGTLRGMHYQKSPYQESKFVRCIRGTIYDVAIDLRPHSVTKGQSFGIKLTSENRRALFVPEDFAHGFITLEDNTEVLYMASQDYVPGAELGIRWDDPKFSINWPINPVIISNKDANWESYSD